ncbi:MAG: AAA family ATPase [Planctomycetes bacterium]|nr:AAA family ATPase [Planctomycetota bacterium]
MADHNRPIPVQAIGWRDVVPLLQPGQMHVCVCQPGSGKSSLALGLARDLVARPADPVQVLYISTDLSVPMLTWKLITAMTGVPYDFLESGTCSPAQLAAVDQAQAAIASWPLVLMAPTDATADQLTTLIHQHASVRSTVVIVDYLGAETLGVTTSSVQTMVRSLASIARELGIPIVATAGYAEDEDLDGADAVLGLGLDEDDASDDQRNVDLFLLRSADGRIDGSRLVFDVRRMTHQPRAAVAGLDDR